ncbi:MAG TPA: serine/threonine protein phosphatase [Papillibacter sp.]|nr:serine/threonine protein phosphatase [Papillibacter sp.]
MVLYAIGDLHLSLQSNKPMDVFGGVWEGYVDKLKNGFSHLTDEDVCVLCGDLTWAMNLEESLDDFRFIEALPGKKILLKGNHDYWWSTTSKPRRFFAQNGLKTLDILHNNCYFVDGTAVCGTRGWFYEEERSPEHDRKIMNREVLRLETSLKAAKGAEEIICFLHYPPIFYNFVCRDIIELMKSYGVRSCYYGHIHGAGHKLATVGEHEGITYHMVSADYVNFCPVRVK